MIVRDWSDALAAHPRDMCVNCGRNQTQLAHLIGRAYDRKKPHSRTRYVHPLSVVRLCVPCHERYDGHTLDLSGAISSEALQWCGDRIGKGQALRRIMGRKPWETTTGG